MTPQISTQPASAEQPRTQQIRTYRGESVDVTYEAGRCIHVAECLRRLPAVFDKSQRPWVQPDHAAAGDVAATVLACPSGALQFARKDGGQNEAIPPQNTIRLTRNGPLTVRGDITIVNSAGEVIAQETRATLCRCGASANKPFCDNSHIALGFKAPGTIDATLDATNSTVNGAAMDEPQNMPQHEEGGKLIIATTANGPLHIRGNFTLLSAKGEVIAQGSEEWFCRCGASEHKPFCDDSHRRIGFIAE